MRAPEGRCDGHALVEHYEGLRNDVVACDRYSRSARGLALLMRKGMAYWMKSLGEHPPSAAAPASPTPVPLPVGVEQPLVEILATMALTTILEVQR